ncbi:hypothetical protein [Microbacterium sp. H1-D42]|uniref:hypothetical protein n=1 Tax=Microbacterium sp. H1-D42 TaxID=2925844 RepID=UPI001F531F9B|nr:hypothetical protein [Microbacterium sp. H1-D42]UNK69436.1 hypothetical protein MNR00_09575 [Microbacterium sp. H1-D42]
MMDLETRYRRLLRWYPRAWRAAHGEVLLGMALDAAEAEGRSRPTRAEIRSIILHGTGERFTLRTALFAAFGALLCSAIAVLLTLTGVPAITQFGGGWIPLALSLPVAGILASAALIVVLRHIGALRPDRALPALSLAAASWVFAFLTAWSWSVGFDEADAGSARTAFAQSFVPLFLTAWAVGGAAIALVICDATRALPRAARMATAVVAAVVCPPIIGVTAVSPFAGLFAALCLIVTGVLLSARANAPRSPADSRGSADADEYTAQGNSVHTISAPRRRIAGLIASFSTVIGIGCAVFALVGASLVPGIDATRAMQIGLGAGTLAGLPTMLAIGWMLMERRPASAAPLAVGTLLIGGGAAIQAITTLSGSAGSGDLPWAAVLPAAAGAGIMTWGLLRLRHPLRILLAASVAIAALMPLWLLLVAAGLVMPIVGAVMTFWGLRLRTERHSTVQRMQPVR